jgi:hypothetical protein
MSTLKQTLTALVRDLPDDCDWRTFYYHLYVAKKLDAALDQIDEGPHYTTDEVKQMLADQARERRENPRKHYITVHSRQQLVDYLFHVQDEVLDHPKQEDVRRHTADYLEALKAWLDTCEGYYQSIEAPLNPNEPSWQLFADALRSAVRFR